MSNKGWISLHRKIQDCWIWEEKPFDKRSAWIDLLLLANHEDKKVGFDGTPVVIKRGQYLTSILKLSDRWGWSRNKTKRFLAVLESEQMITTDRTNKRTIVNIVNYGVYQGYSELGEPTEGQQKDNRRTTDEPQTIMKNNENNENNILDSNESNCWKQTFQQAVTAWNDLEKLGITPVSKMSPKSKRYQMLNKRLKEYGIDGYMKAIDNIRHSDFLLGKAGSKPFNLTFDWFVRPNNFVKVLDGNYNGNRNSGNNREILDEFGW